MAEFLNVFKAPAETLGSVAFDGFQAKVARTSFEGEATFEHYQEAHRVFITLEGHTRATIAEADHHPTVRRPDRPGCVTIVPAGVRRRVLLKDIDFLILDMLVSDEFLRVGAESGAGTPSLPITQNMRNGWLLRAAHALKNATLNGAPRLHLQTLAFALVKHMTRANGRLTESGGLDPVALGRVLQMMHDRMADDLTLTDLAAEAGLGVSAFARAFSKSVGAAPFRYFSTVRMERAKALLAEGRQPLAEIAGAVGYSDQAHFTAAFTRQTGLPPGKWRAELGTAPKISPVSRKTSSHRSA